jgi:hypothetical protein
MEISAVIRENRQKRGQQAVGDGSNPENRPFLWTGWHFFVYLPV